MARPPRAPAVSYSRPWLGPGPAPAGLSRVPVMLVGSLLSSVAFVFGPAAAIVFIIGIIIMVLGLGAGFVMRAMGYGGGGSKLNNSGQ